MFKPETLFVVGAGASCELGFPSGSKLRGQIADKLNITFQDGSRQVSGDKAVMGALTPRAKERGADPNIARQKACQISAAMRLAHSIDDYIDAHQHDPEIELCGKLGIAQCILDAENESSLFPERPEGTPELPDNVWYLPWFQRLVEGAKIDDLEGIFNDVTFVTFNYDRCIEQYTVHALTEYYAPSPTAGQRLARKLKVHHPYGAVGGLPWQFSQGPTVPFGSRVGPADLLTVAQELKTFTEGLKDKHELQEIREAVTEAETIVFLGFAFADQNMALLKPGGRTHTRKVFVAAKGISKSDVFVVEEKIGELLEAERGLTRTFDAVDVEIRNDLGCRELFDEYWRGKTQ